MSRGDAADETRTDDESPLEGLPKSSMRAKTSIPSLHACVVARPRLWSMLESALDSPITVVTAPTGSGKTQMLASWARDTERVVAWLSLERGDGDPHRFWTSFLTAIQKVVGQPGGSTLSTLQPTPGTRHSVSVLPALVVDGLSELDHELVIVIDDIHEVDGTSSAAGLAYLLAHLPGNVRLILSGSYLPDIPRARLRMESRLTSLPAEALAFTENEAQAMLSRAGLEPSDRVVRQLVQRVEGWSAGLRLAALAGTEITDNLLGRHLLSAGDAETDEYLAGEVLNNLPDGIRTFLLHTCVCDRLTGALADALTGRRDGVATLKWLADRNVFTVRQSADGDWFRYHPMFGRMLRRQLGRVEPELVPVLHERTAAWLLGEELWLEAFEHARASESTDLPFDILMSCWLSLFLDGQLITLRDMAEHVSLTANPARDDELCCLRQLVALAIAEPGAHLAFGENVPEDAPPPGLARLVLTLEQGRSAGDVDRVRGAALMLLDGGPARPLRGQSFSDLAAISLYELGVAEYWNDERTPAEVHLRQALSAARQRNRSYIELGCLSQLVGVLTAQDRLNDAVTTAAEGADLAAQRGWEQSVAVADLWQSLGWVNYLRNDHEEADLYLDLADEAVREDDHSIRAAILLTRGLIAASRGEVRPALRVMLEADSEISQLNGRFVFADYVRAEILRLNLTLGHAAPAREALGPRRPAGEPLHLSVTRAELILSDRGSDAAITVLQDAIDDGQGFLDQRIQAQVFLAILEAQKSGARRSLPLLARAVEMAAPERIIQPLLQFGTRAERLLEALERREGGEHQEFISLVRNRMADLSAAQRGVSAAGPEGPLTAREQEILDRLESMLTLPELAAELFVSVNTLKVHLRSLYRKLGAHSRREAVARAQSLRLL